MKNENGMEGTRTVLEQIEPGKSISIMIGPEGGFAEEEIAKARETMQSISLRKKNTSDRYSRYLHDVHADAAIREPYITKKQ